MKTTLGLVLILLLVMVALPMGMGEMGDCPVCTSPKMIALGICLGILSLLVLVVVMAGSRVRLGEQSPRRFLLARSIYRPPRFA